MQSRDDQQPEGGYLPPSDQDIGEIVRSRSRDEGFEPINDEDYDDQLRILLQNPTIVNDLSSFDQPSSFPLQQENVSCLDTDEKRGKNIPSIQGGKRKRKTRSPEEHNLKERLRRQKFKEKMKILEKMIPDCDKRDTASTLDDAIKYIDTLHYQVQMLSGHSMFHSPLMMMPQPTTIFPFDFPIGLPNPYLPINMAQSRFGFPSKIVGDIGQSSSMKEPRLIIPTMREVHSTFYNPSYLSEGLKNGSNRDGHTGCGSGPS